MEQILGKFYQFLYYNHIYVKKKKESSQSSVIISELFNFIRLSLDKKIELMFKIHKIMH